MASPYGNSGGGSTGPYCDICVCFLDPTLVGLIRRNALVRKPAHPFGPRLPGRDSRADSSGRRWWNCWGCSQYKCGRWRVATRHLWRFGFGDPVSARLTLWARCWPLRRSSLRPASHTSSHCVAKLCCAARNPRLKVAARRWLARGDRRGGLRGLARGTDGTGRWPRGHRRALLRKRMGLPARQRQGTHRATTLAHVRSCTCTFSFRSVRGVSPLTPPLVTTPLPSNPIVSKALTFNVVVEVLADGILASHSALSRPSLEFYSYTYGFLRWYAYVVLFLETKAPNILIWT